MDHLHHVIRSLRDTKAPRRDHLAVFREFLSHLDRIGRRAPRAWISGLSVENDVGKREGDAAHYLRKIGVRLRRKGRRGGFARLPA